MIADLLYPQTKLETISTNGPDTIGFVMKINSRRKAFRSISVPVCSAQIVSLLTLMRPKFRSGVSGVLLRTRIGYYR